MGKNYNFETVYHLHCDGRSIYTAKPLCYEKDCANLVQVTQYLNYIRSNGFTGIATLSLHKASRNNLPQRLLKVTRVYQIPFKGVGKIKFTEVCNNYNYAE